MFKFNYKSRQINNINTFSTKKKTILIQDWKFIYKLTPLVITFFWLTYISLFFWCISFFFWKMIYISSRWQDCIFCFRICLKQRGITFRGNSISFYLYFSSVALVLFSVYPCLNFREHFPLFLVRLKNCVVTLCKRHCAKL